MTIGTGIFCSVCVLVIAPIIYCVFFAIVDRF